MTRVKICGITNLDDARAAVELGAWAVGLIFADSPRQVDVADAERIGRELSRQVEVTGVFVNAPLEEVAQLADVAHLTAVQLHGDEGPAYAREVARRTGARVIKAIPAKDPAAVRRLSAFHTDFHLLDAYVPGQRGGTGQDVPVGLRPPPHAPRAADPLRRPEPGQRRATAIARHASVRGRHRERDRGVARPQGPREAHRVLPCRRAGRCRARAAGAARA